MGNWTVFILYIKYFFLVCFLQKISDKEDDTNNLSDTLTVPLKFLPVGHKVKVTLPVRHVSAPPFMRPFGQMDKATLSI